MEPTTLLCGKLLVLVDHLIRINMLLIERFIRRMDKIGIDIGLVGNYPWIYLDTVNGKKVKGTFMANHGFTAFILNVNTGEHSLPHRRILFKKIRKML